MNGLASSMLAPVPLRGPVFAATWCGQLPALTPYRSIDGIEKSQHLLAEASRHWESCPVFWFADASREPGPNLQMSQNLLWLRSMDRGHTTPSPLHAFPVFMEQEMAREGSNQKTHDIADVGMDLLWLALWGV